MSSLDRDVAIKVIRNGLRERSGKPWSVTGGRGTAWGWITITAPPARRLEFGYMTDDDRAELGRLLGLDGPVHHQGEMVPAGSVYRDEYTQRATSGTTTVRATPYWD